MFSGAVPFNSDEAVVALMGRHILQGARPIFFYGQAYMGSFDAWLVAGAFSIFGESVLSVRLTQLFLFVIFLVTFWVMLRRFFVDPFVADIAVMLMALPPVLLTTYTTATLGGYLEILIIGNLVLWLGYEVVFGQFRRSGLAWLILGFLGGLGFWILGMMGVYLLAIGLIGLWKFRIDNWRFYLLAAAGFLLGSSPWWLYNFKNSWAAVEVLIHPGVDTSITQHLISFFLLGVPALFGFRLPWASDIEPWPILFILLILFQVVIINMISVIRKKELILRPGAKPLLWVLIIIFLVVFIGSDYGYDATGRYLLPLLILISSGQAAAIAHSWHQTKIIGVSLLALFLLIFGVQTWRAANSIEKITTQVNPVTRFDNQYDDELIEFLVEHDELRGYSNYWVSYRLAFLTEEKIIYSPRLPYQTDLFYSFKDIRYPLYDELVSESNKIAYITTKNTVLDDLVRRTFRENEISYSEIKIGEYHVYYDLSRDIRPNLLNFE